MVQTRAQSKNVKTPTVKKSSNSTKGKEQEIKPIIIDDIQTAPNPPKVDNQPNTTDTSIHTKYLQTQTYSQPKFRLPPRPPDQVRPTTQITTGIGPNLDFEENSLHQEGIITEMYESQDKSYLEKPQELTDLVGDTKLIHKYLPKQVDIDKS